MPIDAFHGPDSLGPTGPDPLGSPGVSQADVAGKASDVQEAETLPARMGADAVTPAIVVPNVLWRADGPSSYDHGHQAINTHLREVEAERIGRRDRAHFDGAFDLIPTKADNILDLIRANSLWPLLAGLACCAFEMMSAATSKNDMDRFGMFPFRASPRQADVLIAAGTLTTKMAGPFLRIWEQMPDPKWCVAMGDCTTSGGRYKRSYSTIEGIDRIMPVDVYVPGCPPRPEGLIYGMMQLQQLIVARRGHFNERRTGPTVPTDL